MILFLAATAAQVRTMSLRGYMRVHNAYVQCIALFFIYLKHREVKGGKNGSSRKLKISSN